MRAKHTLSHYRLLTGDMGLLYPIGLVEVLPKDAFQHSTNLFLRFSPMAAPVMHPVTVRVHHFFVPHRLVWPQSEGGGWEEFITGGPDGDDAQTVPTEDTTGTASDLWDYFGLPQESGLAVSALPIRAFNLIFNEYYRDQDLVTARLPDDVTVPNIAWEKDYMTTARPWTQKGSAVTLPLGTNAPVKTDVADVNTDLTVYDTTQAAYVDLSADVGGSNKVRTTATGGVIGDSLYADLSAAGAIPINEFRKAFALQRYAEARARYGSRYVEYLRYLGVRGGSVDARLQRPEYLGGGKAQVAMSEVLQTANEAASDRFGVGDLYGHGVASMRSNRYRRHFDEHGYVMSLLSVRPKAIYVNGAERHWLRRDKEDFYQKELEHIGQQEVWDGELFVDATPTVAETYATFGYADRYREYREQQSRIAAEFRDVLDYWHLARVFSAAPTLNASFVESSPSKRIFNVQSQDTMWIAAQHHLVARRLVGRSSQNRIM